MRVMAVCLVSFLLGLQIVAYGQPIPPLPAPPRAGNADLSQHAGNHRMAWKDRFAQANTSHDGHLTLEQAKRGYVTVARHFAQIDRGNKGYVTQDDIAAWHTAQRAARRRSPASAETAQPRSAILRKSEPSDGSNAVSVKPAGEVPSAGDIGNRPVVTPPARD